MILLTLLLASPATAAPPPALTVALAGGEEVVFSRSRDGCGRFDTPDAPARAVRAPTGVALFATHFDNRALRGPSLRDLRPDCRITARTLRTRRRLLLAGRLLPVRFVQAVR
ncbi:MAG: hypothetical protein MUF65_12160, partial [Rubritepida sp.]|nr:hypothetical protein [Rubritepida sp.]